MDGAAFIRILLFCFFTLDWSGLWAQTKAKIPVNYNAEVDLIMKSKNDSLATLESISGFINSAFKKDEDKCRAIFFWITENISYAPELMYTFQTNFNNAKAVKEIMVAKSGICSGYAALADTLFTLCKLPSYQVTGSTKQSFLPTIIGHVWNAVKINNEWKFIDPTWGSGHIKNQRFVKNRYDHYFFPNPEQLITTHLPIDPIWQLMEKPITLHQFYTGGNSTVKTSWNYKDSISGWLALPEIEQVSATIRRLTEFGTNSEITFNSLNYLKSKQNDHYLKKLNHAGALYNKASDLFNDYISFKNKQFTPVKQDSVIARMMPRIKAFVNQSKQELDAIPKEFTETNASYIESMKKYYKELEERVETETAFIKKYLNTKKARRKELFYVKVYGPVK